MSTSHADIFSAILQERAAQDVKFGAGQAQSLPGFIAILENEIAEAKRAWTKAIKGPRQTPLEEILQVAAVAVACLEKYGLQGSAIATDDLSL